LPLAAAVVKVATHLPAAMVNREQLVDREILEVLAAPPMLVVPTPILLARARTAVAVAAVDLAALAAHRLVRAAVLGLPVAQDILETAVWAKMIPAM